MSSKAPHNVLSSIARVASARRPSHISTRFDDIRRIASPFPETVETTSYGTPAFWVGKRLISRQREEDGILAVRVDSEITEVLMVARPDVYFQTPPFEGYAWFQLRLAAIGADELRRILEDACWEAATPTIRKRHPEMRRTDDDG